MSKTKREAVAAQLARDAGRSDRAIARELGVSPTLVGSVRRRGAPSTSSTDIERLSDQVTELTDRVAALETAAAAASTASIVSMDSKAAYRQISKLLPLLKGAQRQLLRERLHIYRRRW